MQRYLLVRGKLSPDGRPIPVANPHLPEFRPARYAGMRLRDKPPEHVRAPLDLYEPCDEAILEDESLKKAIRKGELELINKTPARDLVHARAQFEVMAQQKPAPRTHKKEASNG